MITLMYVKIPNLHEKIPSAIFWRLVEKGIGSLFWTRIAQHWRVFLKIKSI